MRSLPRHFVAFALFVMLGCGGGGATDNSGISMEGSWHGGTNPVPGVFIGMSFTITDDDGDLTGTGTVNGPGVGCSASASGTRHGDNFDVTMGCPGFQAWTYKGTAKASSLTGKLNGSGFVNVPFQMVRD